jgi:hypothetical protein
MSVYDFSNPEKVFKKAHKLGIEEIDLSNRKNKKYKVYDGTKWIHFGQLGYEDYSKHRDKRRRDLFRTRNARWADAPKMSPAWLSYYLLW